MRRLAAGLGLAMGFAWLFRRFRRAPVAPPAPEPAEELKRKLAESREEQAPPPAEPAQQAGGLDERRREVHERARAAIDEMRGEPADG